MLPALFTPDFLSQLELMRLRSRRAFLGTRQGGHVSPKRGHGIEFSDYRKYELGDNPRHIDWGVYARTDRLYVKRFQEEQDLSVLIIVDTSASMGTPPQEGKWERARDLTLALSYVALMQQDSVMVSALGCFHSPTLHGGKSIHTLGNALGQVVPADYKDFPKDMRRAASRIRFPGLAILISDFLMPLSSIQQAFLVLRAKNLDITAIQLLGPSDINPLAGVENALAVDSETGEELELTMDPAAQEDYASLLEEHNTRLGQFLFDGNIPFVQSLVTDDFIYFLQSTLTKTGLLR